MKRAIISIKNDSRHSIAFRETDLPWSTDSSLVVVVVDKRTGAPVPRMYPIQDEFGPPPPVNLPAGQSLTGTRQISEFFGSSSSKITSDNRILCLVLRSCECG